MNDSRMNTGADGRSSEPRIAISSEISRALEPFENSQRYLNEAEFGYRHVRNYVERCPVGSRVLEVGSGPCALLSQLTYDFPELRFTGIEPVGPAFTEFGWAIEELRNRLGFNLIQTGYEDFMDPGKFDLIFLVNVFEHLPDWRHFLRFVSEKLEDDGRCLILCPNYGFPYESHFSLPIIFNKQYTYRVFHSKITRHEREHNCQGLWESLNFVKWAEVKEYAAELRMNVVFNGHMLREMIERLDKDPEFAERQKSVSTISKVSLKLGIVRMLENSLFHRIHPYMNIELTQAKNT